MEAALLEPQASRHFQHMGCLVLDQTATVPASYSTRVATVPAHSAALPNTPAQSRTFWSAPAAPATTPAVSSSFQTSLLLAYVRGFLEPSEPEFRADASGTFQNISRAPDHVRAPFLDPEHPDTQLGICSPASAAWPRFCTRYLEVVSAGGPLDSPAYRDPRKPPVSLPNVSGRTVRDTLPHSI